MSPTGKKLLLILKILITIHLLWFFAMQVVPFVVPTLLSHPVAQHSLTLYDLETETLSRTLVLLVGQGLLLLFLYKPKWLRVIISVLLVSSVGFFLFQTYFLTLPELEVEGTRIGERTVLVWEAEQNTTYTIERGTNKHQLQTIYENSPMGFFSDLNKEEILYYRVIAYHNRQKKAISKIIELPKTVDTDGDGLLDTEEKDYDTDPKKIDSDEDELTDYEEIHIYKTNPLKADSDGDGLLDGVEVYLGLNPLKTDSDGDGLTDDQEDLDEDNLSNKEEVEFHSDGLLADSDFDLLIDGDEYTYRTDPNKIDSDQDGVYDGDEVMQGTDPTKVDSDNDGIPDGSEKIVKQVTLTDGDGRITPSIKVPVAAQNQNNVSIKMLDSQELFKTGNVPGYMGEAYFIYSPEVLVDATVTFSIDSKLISDDTEPTLYVINEETHQFDEVMGQELKENILTAPLTQSAKFIVLNKRKFEDAWTIDFSQEAQNKPFVFVIDKSGSMDDNDPSDLRLRLTEQFLDKIQEVNGKAGLVTFAKQAETLASLTSDFSTLKRLLSSIKNDGGTNGRAGLYQAIQELESEEITKKKYIIFLTDGKDTENFKYSYDELNQMANDRNITIYTVGLGNARTLSLEDIANQAGGSYYYAEEVEQLEPIYTSIGNQTTKVQPEILKEDLEQKEEILTDKQLALLADLSYLDDTTREAVSELENRRTADHKGESLGHFKTQMGKLNQWYVYDQVEDSLNGFSVTIFKKNHDYVLAFRGSNDDSDWLAHGVYFTSLSRLSNDFHTQDKPTQRFIATILNRLKGLQNSDATLYITGHSLGGRLSLIANGKVADFDLLTNKRDKVRTFNALGVANTDINQNAYSGDNVNYFVDGEFLSGFGFGPTENEKRIQLNVFFAPMRKHDIDHFLIHPDVQGD